MRGAVVLVGQARGSCGGCAALSSALPSSPCRARDQDGRPHGLHTPVVLVGAAICAATTLYWGSVRIPAVVLGFGVQALRNPVKSKRLKMLTVGAADRTASTHGALTA